MDTLDDYIKELEKQIEENKTKGGLNTVQIMEPYQMLYNIMMNRLEEQINKEYKNRVIHGKKD